MKTLTTDHIKWKKYQDFKIRCKNGHAWIIIQEVGRETENKHNIQDLQARYSDTCL